MNPVQTPIQVSALFCHPDSAYWSIPGVDVFYKARNALTYNGDSPVIAHPPCRAWSRLRAFARPEPGEAELGLWAVETVRRWGGVLEHPSGSALWRAAGLPAVGSSDEFGFSVLLDQFCFGHRARKRTWLYVCGCSLRDMPAVPLRLGEASHTCGLYSRRDRTRARPEIRKTERELTPPEFARWLVAVARLCSSSSDVQVEEDGRQ